MLSPEEVKTLQQELTADPFAVITSFADRMTGMLSHEQKELVTCAQAKIFSP